MDTIKIRAYGKVNLGLDVTGRRPDGYHLVRMIMQTVDVYDELTLSGCLLKSNAGENAQSEISLSCSRDDLPTDSRNLAYKAAQLVCRTRNISAEIHIDIKKNIPAAAGMAGGSADAAAVIKALDELFRLGMTLDEMDAIALQLGADVPFCLRKGTFLSEGIGEILTQIKDLAGCSMVIVKPDCSVSTPWAYKALDEYMAVNGNTPDMHPDIDRLMDAIDSGNIEDIGMNMGNILELVTVPEHPEIQDIKDRLEKMGAVRALMSGSGPTVFGIFRNGKQAETAYHNLGGEKYGKFKVEF